MKFLLWLALAAPVGAQGREAWEADPAILSPGGINLFQHGDAPLSFQTMTPREIPKDAVLAGEVSGRSCQHGVSIPIAGNLRAQRVSGAGGRGGYGKAFEDILKRHPGLRGIYDVKVDLRTTTVLGIYRRLCTQITAYGFR